MNEIVASSTTTIFLAFAVIGSVLVYLILLFDKRQRRKLKAVLSKTGDVKPLFMVRAANEKLHTIKQICDNDASAARTLVARQLDELVADYDKGNISLNDYCNKLNRLLAMVA
ncbi:hypothetical protein FPZ43_13435 [Mucilaginibacter pallidiroseus]|uniref:Uncharacterized protein n=1 Tax=Mucilaginibacter pallidiroseus TaxID=2599295 RepID=A0A563U823_9SPHI|nr:hypothetical protein [Mucilaginibacter pallidiroseus]TWR27473.1 hypothetical protein FPZ43_13435 [Mucilaginibacter pallidiroseus]